MAVQRMNFMPGYVDPQSNWDTKMRGVAGGDPRFFDYGRFGLLDDNSVLKSRIEGPARRSSGGGSSFTGSGMAQTGFSGGTTSSKFSGYNWDTLQRNMQRGVTAAQNLVEFRMENKRLSSAKQRKQDEEFMSNASNTIGNVYGAGQDPYTQAFATAGQKAAQSQAAQKIQGIKNLASQVVPPSQNLTASKQASSNTMVAGASRPIGGRKTQPVNLLYPNGLPKKGSRKPSKNSPYAGPQPPAPPII